MSSSASSILPVLNWGHLEQTYVNSFLWSRKSFALLEGLVLTKSSLKSATIGPFQTFCPIIMLRSGSRANKHCIMALKKQVLPAFGSPLMTLHLVTSSLAISSDWHMETGSLVMSSEWGDDGLLDPLSSVSTGFICGVTTSFLSKPSSSFGSSGLVFASNSVEASADCDGRYLKTLSGTFWLHSQQYSTSWFYYLCLGLLGL